VVPVNHKIWYVLDMDEGVLVTRPSRVLAVQWAQLNVGTGGKVLKRQSYGPGFYDYWIGTDMDDCDTVAIVREDMLEAYGLSDEHRRKWRKECGYEK
jgi:hypothetical protein